MRASIEERNPFLLFLPFKVLNILIDEILHIDRKEVDDETIGRYGNIKTIN